jgi:hypothetical protein
MAYRSVIGVEGVLLQEKQRKDIMRAYTSQKK